MDDLFPDLTLFGWVISFRSWVLVAPKGGLDIVSAVSLLSFVERTAFSQQQISPPMSAVDNTLGPPSADCHFVRNQMYIYIFFGFCLDSRLPHEGSEL